jgi:hypothetical protein
MQGGTSGLKATLLTLHLLLFSYVVIVEQKIDDIVILAPMPKVIWQRKMATTI